MIILEGPDGSGKTTLARKLSFILGRPIWHPGKAPEPEIFMHSVFEGLDALREKLICDRINPISEIVYGPIINHREIIDIHFLNSFLQWCCKNQILLVYCAPKDREVFKAEQAEYDTDQDMRLLRRRHNKIITAYDNVFSAHRKVLLETNDCLVVYDYHQEDEGINTILKNLERKNTWLAKQRN